MKIWRNDTKNMIKNQDDDKIIIEKKRKKRRKNGLLK